MMKKALLVVLSLFAVGAAGPVGRYLGYAVGKVAVDSGAGYDSIHFFLPSPADSIVRTNISDTTTVLAETTLSGAAAWILRAITMSDTSRSERADTAFESGDTLLRTKLGGLGASLWLNMYRVPFQVGAWWRTGAAGTYYSDLNGDSLEDTLDVYGDTVRVIASEDVTVPYGTVRNCYKLQLVLRQVLRMKYEGAPMRESGYVQEYNWYKDSLWRVKDSTLMTARAYTRVLVWLRMADIYSLTKLSLMGLKVGTEDPPATGRLPAPTGNLSCRPNPFKTNTAISLRLAASGPFELRIYDPTGRLVRTLAVSRKPSAIGAAVWDGRDRCGRVSSPGVYLIRAPGVFCPVTRLE